MKKREGFTLAELIMAIFIFGFLSASLVTIYSTANRHMLQNYRRNTIKANVDLSMKVIQNKLVQATRIDAPQYTGATNRLAIVENVDQVSRCYPIRPGGVARWHYFCMAPDNLDPTVNDLYYHTGTLPAGTGTACGTVAPSIWNGVYPVLSCGFGGGGTVTILMQRVVMPLPPLNPFMFSRIESDGINERDNIRVSLRSFWAGGSFNSTDIDFSLSSVVKLNIPAEPVVYIF